MVNAPLHDDTGPLIVHLNFPYDSEIFINQLSHIYMSSWVDIVYIGDCCDRKFCVYV